MQFMYDSSNLPLSPRKVFKKFLARSWSIVLMAAIILVPVLFNLSSGTNMTPGSIAALKALLIAVGFLILLIIANLIYEYLYYKFYYYQFSEDAAEVRKGVVSRATGHVRYERLQNIYVDQDFLDRIFGLYDVHYETAGERSHFYSHVDGLLKKNADTLVDFLKEQAQLAYREPSKREAPEVGNVSSAINFSVAIMSRATHPIQKALIWITTAQWTIFFIVPILITLHLAGLSLFMVVVATISIFILFWIYEAVWYKNFNFVFEGERGEIFHKVIGSSRSYFYYNRIQNVTVNQGILDRLVGINSIVIETAGETSAARFSIPGFAAKEAEAIKDFLLERARKYKKL